MNHLVIAGCLAVFGVLVTRANRMCNKETIEPAWIKCDKTYFAADVKDEATLKKMCESVDILIQCKKDAVGDCYKRAEFRGHLFLYDPERWKVYFRFICSNIVLAESQFASECVVENTCSSENMVKNFNPALKDKQALCSMYEKMRKCVRTSPAGQCTAAVAKFQENIKKLGYSVSICDNIDIKDLYTLYGGTRFQGGTSGTSRIVLSLQAISFVIFHWILYQCRRMLKNM
ncbi:uncharacterized protein LOC123564908 [Mercenaria mercenaria]|uniref:uncharacterized protein LOC123564908 n=1 Tax=Mercenaria mercenaria TaxID=6596 RepID=UPI00234ECECE|nr:uncharacterized protein LOC123564908 [Mercenaria mercenaria]